MDDTQVGLSFSISVHVAYDSEESNLGSFACDYSENGYWDRIRYAERSFCIVISVTNSAQCLSPQSPKPACCLVVPLAVWCV